jgi:hypothetical protein
VQNVNDELESSQQWVVDNLSGSDGNSVTLDYFVSIKLITMSHMIGADCPNRTCDVVSSMISAKDPMKVL